MSGTGGCGLLEALVDNLFKIQGHIRPKVTYPRVLHIPIRYLVHYLGVSSLIGPLALKHLEEGYAKPPDVKANIGLL